MKRILTAAILAPLIAYVVLWAPGFLFIAVLATVALLCFHEYAGIIAAYGIERPGIAGFVAGLVVLLSPRDSILVPVLVALAALTMALGARDFRGALPRAGALVLGVLYTFGMFRFAVPLRALSEHWLLFALVVAWVGDAAAYYVGRAIGRHRMAPRVSPGKSWEGAAASLAASMIFGALYVPRFIAGQGIVESLIVAAVANVTGQVGDLAESVLKRGAGVKDSGAMLPGHGGWLDRVDSSLFIIPVTWWLVGWCGL